MNQRQVWGESRSAQHHQDARRSAAHVGTARPSKCLQILETKVPTPPESSGWTTTQEVMTAPTTSPWVGSASVASSSLILDHHVQLGALNFSFWLFFFKFLSLFIVGVKPIFEVVLHEVYITLISDCFPSVDWSMWFNGCRTSLVNFCCLYVLLTIRFLST